MNLDMVKPEKSDHLHLVYHFTVPLRTHSKKPLDFHTWEKATKIIFTFSTIIKLIMLIGMNLVVFSLFEET